ncbi:MAG TPA: LLM class F420-dependent oxidoreductase [Actinomycetota bacterium]|jgi:probable F420-dependent oxidoreductase
MRLGVTPPVEVAGFPAAVDVCVRAEGLGYTDVWTAEIGAVDAFSPLAAVATRTAAVRLGTALVPVFTRPPALVAMGAAGIQNLSGGRFVLGIGASSPAIVGRWMGIPFEDPVARVEEYVALLRDMLAGRKVDHDGRTVRTHGFRLQIGVDAPVPIHVGALGPRMCRLAGRVADGVLFFLMTPDGVRQALAEVHVGAREAGRDPAEIEAFIRLPVSMGEPEETARFMARRMLTGYAIVPAYNASLARQGYAAEAGEIAGRWAAGERDRAAQAFSDDLLDATFLLGDARTSNRRIAEYRDAGITTPVLMPVSVAGSSEERAVRVRALVEALAPGRSAA